ncbi:MAG: toxin-antitoxin system, antitoxin component, Xre family protein [Gallionellales bacterium RIFCSPLOWO2_12_FULL_59_22]|nr:MAG: toxin-antitoxin system, antitoxin component, Xre family protein [Gallionellales bacterium RIFCSPLOWO2_02_FULL_59_110]OGT04871.1 MAG: toxin-antitoxin system, antitoxin component, Xre family protein [Gallionellales bacterium RIFCSPLOWO2_02_58_13]OGT10701.1 MAG: toxin-antitoxin system, antitoxin component, Xre family protein [Gallionellales bacterium RIFCSPLOWO2_12_FULL_59_22]
MNITEHLLIEKILQLPPTRRAEVADFVDFLCSREGDRALVQAATQTSIASFAATWDNDADAAYDAL